MSPIYLSMSPIYSYQFNYTLRGDIDKDDPKKRLIKKKKYYSNTQLARKPTQKRKWTNIPKMAL